MSGLRLTLGALASLSIIGCASAPDDVAPSPSSAITEVGGGSVSSDCASDQYAALNDWLGLWRAFDARTGQPGGIGRTSTILGGCVVLEEWDGINRAGEAYDGAAFHRFDRATNRWVQVWVDDDGDGQTTYGAATEGGVIYEWRRPTSNGSAVVGRQVLRANDDGSFVNAGDRSTDGGVTRTPTFSLRYERSDEARAFEFASPGPNAAQPECQAAGHRAMDQWVGAWRATDVARGRVAGRTTVRAVLGGCVLVEEWDGLNGRQEVYRGVGFHRFDRNTNAWVQEWVDDDGDGLTMTGAIASPGAITYTWEREERGQRVLYRQILRPLEGGRYSNSGERSVDGGATWTPTYALLLQREPQDETTSMR